MKEKKIESIFMKVSLSFQDRKIIYTKDLNILNEVKPDIRIYFMELVLTQFVFLFYQTIHSLNVNSSKAIFTKFLSLLLFSSRNRVLRNDKCSLSDLRSFFWLIKILHTDQTRNLNLFISLYKSKLDKKDSFHNKRLLIYILETLLLKTTQILVYSLLIDNRKDFKFTNYLLKDTTLFENRVDVIKNKLYFNFYSNIFLYESKCLYYGIYPLLFIRGSKVLKKFCYYSFLKDSKPSFKFQHLVIVILELLESITYLLSTEV